MADRNLAKEKCKENLAAEKAAKRASKSDKISKGKNLTKKKFNKEENNEVFLDKPTPNEEQICDENTKESRESNDENDEQQPTKEDFNTNTPLIEEANTDKVKNMFTILDIGSYVIAKHEGELYCKTGINHWKWLDSPDLLWYKVQDILLKINNPKAINTRGVCAVPEMKAL
ncbi:unnamed protein product [Brassicogethes aeneus]|uniref:Uncharacterized protein n=1 Tax=Brassicogethes aeneus TaxID=1431903 RepID=A0A9P0BMT5_BRAAE|nr:unnamed protein product [Brassicogethes aeneus]